MIVEFGHRSAVALETENVTAAYDCSEVLSDMTVPDRRRKPCRFA